MNFAVAMLMTILLAPPAPAEMPKEGNLLGCPDPIVLGKSLETIQRENWETISVNSVISTWPGQFDELVCQSDTPCRIIVSKNRIVQGHCECCESFVFDAEAEAAGPKKERLKNIIIHFSAASRGNVLEGAKRLTLGAGVPSADIAALGKDSVQRFEWTTTLGNKKYSDLAEVQIKKVGPNWEFYLSLSRHETKTN